MRFTRLGRVMFGMARTTLISLLDECVAILNRLGLGKFSVCQAAGKATVSVNFEGIEIAWADTKRRQYYSPPLKIPISIPDPPDAPFKKNILNSLLSCAIAIKVFGDKWEKETFFILELDEYRSWAIAPENPAATAPFVITCLTPDDDSEPHQIQLILYPSPSEEPKFLKINIDELPDLHTIRKIAALTML
jgi:hypothetical protein